jgi:hypothetical protein
MYHRQLTSTHQAIRGQGYLFALICVLVLGLVSVACASPGEGTMTPESTVVGAGGITRVIPAPGEERTEQAPAQGAEASTTIAALASEVAPSAPAADRAVALAALADVPSVTVVEDWATFQSADEIENTITRNLGMGDNSMDLSLDAAGGDTMPPGGALMLTYRIGASAPHDFVGFNRDLDTVADWSGATAVAFWVAATSAPDVNVVFQFREHSGEVWRHAGAMPAPRAGAPLVVGVDKDAFLWADWSTTENGEIDLAAVDQYGFYVGHQGPGKSGTVRLGPIVLVR